MPQGTQINTGRGMNREILEGDVLDRLTDIESDYIDTIITSPPYYQLRSYFVEGQIGLEHSLQEYLSKLTKVMIQCKRVIKPTGSIWVNLGDTYAGTNNGTVKPKSRMAIPERFYINCIDKVGLIARNDIIWHKPNPVPSSVKDRFTNHFEHVYFFVKESKYHFNLDAVRIPSKHESKPFNMRIRESKKGLTQAKLTGGMSAKEDKSHNKKGEIKEKYKDLPNSNVARLHKDRAGNPNYIGTTTTPNPNGKNPGDIFTIPTKPFPEAHQAMFPPDLPLKIIKCAVPKDGIVLDIFMGAGTTALAAEMQGRQWMGIELNPEYIKIARKRLAKWSNDKL